MYLSSNTSLPVRVNVVLSKDINSQRRGTEQSKGNQTRSLPSGISLFSETNDKQGILSFLGDKQSYRESPGIGGGIQVSVGGHVTTSCSAHAGSEGVRTSSQSGQCTLPWPGEPVLENVRNQRVGDRKSSGQSVWHWSSQVYAKLLYSVQANMRSTSKIFYLIHIP